MKNICFEMLKRAFRSDLELLVPQVVQSDGLHCTVVTESAAEHFLQHVDQVRVMLCVHCVVVVKVEKHYLRQDQSVSRPNLLSTVMINMINYLFAVSA